MEQRIKYILHQVPQPQLQQPMLGQCRAFFRALELLALYVSYHSHEPYGTDLDHTRTSLISLSTCHTICRSWRFSSMKVHLKLENMAEKEADLLELKTL